MLTWTTSRPVPGGWGGGSATSGHLDTATAAMEVANTIHDKFGSSPDLVVVFGSFHHGAAFTDAMNSLRRILQPGCLIATTADSVLGDDVELDGVSGLSALAMKLPGVEVTPGEARHRIHSPFPIPVRCPSDWESVTRANA